MKKSAMEATGEKMRGNSEDLTGRKKPKMQVLKSRLYERMKKKRSEGVMKQSQSVSDIMEGILHQEDDFHCSQSMLGSRSLSHDSIFLADKCQSNPEQQRISSQENIHGKIRTLQMKLQQQIMHLGPPPPGLPIKHIEDPRGSSEDDGLPHSPHETLALSKNTSNKSPISTRNHISLSLGGTGSEEEEQSSLQPSSQPVSPQPTSPIPTPLSFSSPGPGVDFSTPPEFIPRLDNSAARHRMSIKPRNQRASTKNRRLPPADENRPRSESMNNLERPLTESEEEEGIAVTKEMTRVRSYSSQIIRPGDGLTAPPIKSLLPTSPMKSTARTEDGSRSAVTEPETNISPTLTSIQHPILKNETPTWEAASRHRPESAMTTTAVLGIKHVFKSVEAKEYKLPSSAVPASKKGGGDLREVSNISRPKIQDCSTLPVRSPNPEHLLSVTSDQNKLQAEKQSSALGAYDRKDMLNKSDARHEGHLRGHLQTFPQTSAGGAALRPPSLRRNTSPLDKNTGCSGNLQLTSTVPCPALEEQLLKESTNQHRPASGSLCFSVSSAKCQDNQRTGSFTGVVEPAGEKREHVPQLMFNLKTQDQHRGLQLRTTGLDPCVNPSQSVRNKKDTSTSAVPTKSSDLTPTPFAGCERALSQASETQEIGVEATEEEVHEAVEEADEASEDLKGNEVSEEGKEEEQKNAFGIKLRNMSSLKDQSEHKVPLPTVPATESLKDISLGPLRETIAATVLKKPPTLISAQVSSSLTLSRDQERSVPIGLSELRAPVQLLLSPSKGTRLVHSSVPKESTPECLMETATKEPQDASAELSWMSMAREKTRSLQQLFTSRLPDFASLQTATRSTNTAAAPPQAQTTTSLPSSEYTRAPHAPSAVSQSPVTQCNLLTTHSTVAQPLPAQSSIKQFQPSTGQSRSEDFSIKRTLSATSQAEMTQLSSKSGHMSACTSSYIHSTTKEIQSKATCTQFSTQSIDTAKQSSRLSAHQTQSVLQFSPQNVSMFQASQAQPIPYSTQPSFIHLSSSPKLLSQPRIQMGESEQASMPQGKGQVESRTFFMGGPGSRSSITERWEYRTSDQAKVYNQKCTPETRTQLPSVAAFRPMSSQHRSAEQRFTESESFSGAMRVDKEDKWQKKTTITPSSSPSSPSPLQSISDSGQPSWMELAKRKSLAWSDKSMD